jgi:hypothetical protein
LEILVIEFTNISEVTSSIKLMRISVCT